MYQRGFSLVEMLAGLVIAGIFLQFASSPFTQLIESNRRQDAAQILASGLRNARTEAILRHQTVVIHALDDDWSRGWRIILDRSGKGAQDSDNPVLIERQADRRIPIVGNRPVEHYVRFSNLGQPLMPSGAFQAGTLHLCARDQALSLQQVVLSRTGRISLRSDKTEQKLCASA